METFNEELRKKANNILSKIRGNLEIQYNSSKYEIIYHKAVFYWEDKFSIRKFISKLHTNHWEVNEVIKGSRINCMGNGCGIISGLFTKKKMKKQLLASARYWENIKED